MSPSRFAGFLLEFPQSHGDRALHLLENGLSQVLQITFNGLIRQTQVLGSGGGLGLVCAKPLLRFCYRGLNSSRDRFNRILGNLAGTLLERGQPLVAGFHQFSKLFGSLGDDLLGFAGQQF